ncbi:MAG TPA: hypothetical protein VLH56_01225 [Dissulfurispiraceae bacterium]|nr:hypothetical protein [Dissulfurispiraceae bacterium]
MKISDSFRALLVCALILFLFFGCASVQEQVLNATDSVRSISGARLPDLEPVDLYRVDTRLKVAVINHGFAFAGDVEFRVAAAESIVAGERDFVQDRRMTVPIAIGTGGVAIVDLGSIDWPGKEHPALDHPQLHVGVRVDPQGKVPERLRINNSIERTMRVPCGVMIEKAEQNRFQEGLPSLLVLHGRFGAVQKTKGVVVRSNGRESHLLVAEWQYDILKVVLPKNIPAGRYEVLVQCTEKTCGQGYFTSNSIGISVIRDLHAEP